MAKVGKEVLVAVQDALEQYEQEVQDAEESGFLTEQTKKTYLLHAKHFVRWLDDDFEPGGRGKNNR